MNSSMIRISPGEELRQSTRKVLALGTRGMTVDGREFRYSRCGASNINVGRLVSTHKPMSDIECGATAARLATQITTYSTTASFLRVSATWAGACTEPGGATGYVKNVFKDGYVYVVAGSTVGPDNGGGQMLRIKESTTGSTGTASQYIDISFRDDERLHEAIDTGCRVVVMRNPYDMVLTSTGVADGSAGWPILGVTPRDVTARYYFWLQTKGPAPVHTSGTLVMGQAVVSSTDAAAATTGAVGPSTGTGTGAVRKHIGTVLNGSSSDDGLYTLIDLDL